ncbi:hypothetical protein PU630_17005 [Microbacterium horticulturae]|uniref:ScoMcrA-like N-terminal head domain-containing protein n=1 Tax=Microbacterium horticulturae TaxID=3028316 RepID=A0ABY8BXJ9_9MICO|nr:hypothetical protein [Microbacterium sp. KACC 23027]WEG08916.1 hypothetical protein PU630_17005 [Microbacterium sp. KACC 23027]
MVSYADLTDRRAVERALDEFDRLGRWSFLEKYGYGEAKDYFLVTDTGRYDSKAIFAAAYEAQHGVAIANDEISGGKTGTAKRLQELGFVIEGLDDELGRRTFRTFDAALREFQIPSENLTAVREHLAQFEFSEAYIPRSGSYIAMVPADGGLVHYINPGSIYFRKADGTGELIALPVNQLGRSGFSRNASAHRPTEVCPECWLELPSSGVCPNH